MTGTLTGQPARGTSIEHGDAIARLRGLVDPKTGVVGEVRLLSLTERDPVVFMAHAAPASTVPITGLEAANRGAACSAVPERAVIRAVGESVERYCSAIFDVEELRLASMEELGSGGERYVAPGDVYPFTAAQYDEPGFPYRSMAGRRLRWVPGRPVGGDELVWLPAGCVYVPYLFDAAVEPFTHMPISTGLAAGPDRDGCIAKGLLEILERDALMIVWYARLRTPRIDPASCRGISRQIDALLRAPRGERSRWCLNVLTLDVDVPVISASLIDDADPPLTSFGISADPDPERALLLALEEALLTRVLVNRSDLPSAGVPESSIRTLRDHLVAHASSAALRERMRFLTDEGPVVGFREWAARLPGTSPVAALAAAGYESFWTDVTTPDVAEHGLWTTRAIVPGMQPLDNDHRHRFLGGRRLLDVPARMGRPLTLDDLNPDPHPFP